MLLKFWGLIAVVSVAICLVPAGAHFFELANKMSMSQPEYMTVQKIYAGWSFFGIAVIAALLLTDVDCRTGENGGGDKCELLADGCERRPCG